MPPYCPSHTLEVEREGSGSGTVTSSPAGIECGSKCSAGFEEHTEVTLTATAAPGSTFAGWSGGGCSGVEACVVKLEDDTTVTATFEAEPVLSFTLKVKRAGSGSGSVTSSPGGIECGGECSAEFEEGAKVKLFAKPATGSTFAGWSGGGCSGTGACTVTIGTDTTVTATFDETEPPPPTEGKVTVGPTASVKKGKAAVTVTCTGGSCDNTLVLAAKVRKGKKTPTVVIGIAPFSLGEGESETLSVKLSGRAKRELRKHGKLIATATGTGVVISTVLLTQAKKKH
jgi:Divergent InlB B-repeat domain